MSQRTFAILGSEWHLPTKTPRGRKDAPAVTEHRGMAIAEAIDPKRLEEIHEEARVYAAEVMAAFERRTGR